MKKEKQTQDVNAKPLVRTEKTSSFQGAQEPKVLDTPISSRGRIFEGIVISKFPKRVAIEFERVVYAYKYERYFKKKVRIHARLPDSMAPDINIGDYIQVQECRPLSKLIHHIVLKKVKSKENKEQAK